ncbi:MAG TPA: MFS transporter [Candidatus Dormibacteraeota bacterium]|nr:MFS transporter [Candidatus Dormibacteraeota bacterium]
MAASEHRGLNWAYALLGVADGTLLPFIPLYLFQRGLDAVQIGAVLAVIAGVSLVAGLTWSYLSDRRLHAEHLVVLASGAACAVALTIALATGGTEVAIAIVALSLVRAPFMLLDPIALRRLMHSSRTDYARIRLRTSAGWTLSAVTSGTLFQGVGLRLMPFVYAPLVAVFGLWVRHAIRPEGTTAVAAGPLQVRRIPWPLVGFMGACFLLGVSLAATQNFLTLRINFLGGGALLVGAAAAFQALTEIPTMASMHVLRRRFSNRALFALGCAVYIGLFVAWGLVSDALTAALLKLAAGVAFALTFVAAVMITEELAPSHLRATGQALMKSVLFGMAPIVGAFGGGLVYGTFGSRTMFIASTVVAGAAALIAVVAVPGRAPEPKPSLQERPA